MHQIHNEVFFAFCAKGVITRATLTHIKELNPMLENPTTYALCYEGVKTSPKLKRPCYEEVSK